MSSSSFKKFIFIFNPLFVFFSLLMFSVTVTAASIQVKSDRNPVALNESFQLIYESSGSVDDDPDFSLLGKYLEVINRSQSSNISIVNGRYSSTKTWTLTVIARQVGVIVLPPVLFGSDQSPSFKITVKDAVDNQPETSGFYSRMRVDHQQVYAQQQLVLTQQLFSNKNLSAYGMGELDFNGMDVISLPLGEERQYKTRIADKTYLVIERSYAIFPQSAGLLKISPVMAEARLGRASSSFFDSFGSSQVIRARSNALDIAVLPVPKNINVNPWLPAKSFQVLEQWPQNPPKFVQGEPLTRTLSIKAEGLTAAQLPVLPEISIQEIKQYPDQPLLNDITNDNGITGYRVEKVALIPTVAGEVTLPAIEIPWWNTVTQQREVASISARTIQVIPSVSATETVTKAAPEQQNTVLEKNPPESIKVPATEVITGQYGHWKILTIVFALAWIVTLLGWFFMSRKKQVNIEIKERPDLSIQQYYQQLKTACNQKDTARVRLNLVNWAKNYYPENKTHHLQDIMLRVPDELSQEIKKLDAVLYGGQLLEINFELIKKNIGLLMKSIDSRSTRKQPDLLEPLYK